MDWITIGKFAVQVVAGSAVNQVLKQAIIATTPPDISKFQRLTLGLGGFILSGWISHEASEYVVSELDMFLKPKVNDEEKNDRSKS